VSPAAEDLEAIKQLRARYCRLLDTKDWEGWRDVFTEDVIAVVDNAVSTGGADGRPGRPGKGSTYSFRLCDPRSRTA